jgi:hypothetical protein
VETQRVEHAENAAGWVRLHRIAQDEAEGRRKGQGRASGRFESGAIVDIAGGAETRAHLGGDLGAEERGGGRDRVVHGRSSYLRTVAPARPSRPTSPHPSCPGPGRPLELSRPRGRSRRRTISEIQEVR